MIPLAPVIRASVHLLRLIRWEWKHHPVRLLCVWAVLTVVGLLLR